MVLAVALVVVTAGCAGITPDQPEQTPQQTDAPPTESTTHTASTPSTESETYTETATPEPTPTPERGGLLVVSPADEDADDHPSIEYNQTLFAAVPVLNESVTAVVTTNESVSSDLSAEQLNSLDQFLAEEYNVTRSDIRVVRNNTTLDVSVAREV
ncbi:hypothetical protein SAMN04488691_101234 [Haloferax larsenii]|uniref:Uncharacterized protein n=2 Tax=Haloferax larsenii TaxID=302484 RepID=A0A1H7G6H5_HALLR|nr:hypothetical protein SAMN04488691_101234 [Haloferax larsenii]